MVGVFCLRAAMAATLSELLQRENRGENRRPLRRLSGPPRVALPLFITFRSPEGLAEYVERLREKESFSQLFDRLESEKRYGRVRIAESVLREQRRNARRVEREILWRKLLRLANMIARRLGLASDNSY